MIVLTIYNHNLKWAGAAGVGGRIICDHWRAVVHSPFGHRTQNCRTRYKRGFNAIHQFGCIHFGRRIRRPCSCLGSHLYIILTGTEATLSRQHLRPEPVQRDGRCRGGGSGFLQEGASSDGRIPEARLGKIEFRVTILLTPPPRDSGVWRAGFRFELVSIGDRKCQNPAPLSRKSPRKPQFFILTLFRDVVPRRKA